VRAVAALSLAGAVCAVLGGVIFWAAHGGTTLTRSIAYGFWFAATVTLILSVLSGRSLIWTRTDLPVVDGWVFVTATLVLTAAGAAVDVAGTL
jgi:hypothetical protein